MPSAKDRETETLREQIRQLQEQVQDFERLNKVLETVCSAMQVEEVLKRILEEALSLCHASQGSILLLGSGTGQEAKTLIREGAPVETIVDHYLNTLLAGWISRHKEPLLTSNLVETFGADFIEKKYEAITSVLSVPLILQDKIIGVINLVTLGAALKLGNRELRLLKTLASQCAQFIVNARLHEEIFAETTRLQKEVQGKYALHGIIGHSPKMQEVFALLEKIIPTDGRVLINGESGTGKELIARVIHYNGARKDRAFVAVDCGALPANLLESELFGYVKGAFTGANRDKKGLFEEANRGTLFLDEIVNMPFEVQARLLRAIQEDEIRPVGSTQVKKVDVRVIAAASANLKSQLEAGNFRQDLYYRLNVVSVHLPPLRERKEDIVILADHFLKQAVRKYGKSIKGFHADAVAFMEAYAWPGDVRELENVMERMAILAEQDLAYLTPDLLPAEIRPQVSGSTAADSPETSPHDMKVRKDTFEKRILLDALVKHNWNRSAAARELGVSEKTVRYKMKKFGIIRQE
ncbi:MAG: sigma 54-interacting transcriptional regulator [bacterium]